MIIKRMFRAVNRYIKELVNSKNYKNNKTQRRGPDPLKNQK